MKKINMTVGRFQPFTLGHLNMVNEGEGPCIVYQIAPPAMPSSINDLKVNGKKVKKEQLQKVLAFLNHEDVKLTEDEKEILKRPFSNALVTKELDIIKKNNPYIVDIVYVKNVFDAIDQFNAFCTEQADEYEPQYWMCGDDRVDRYSELIDKYDELETRLGSKETIPNVLKGKLKTNIGKGRTVGVSGTAVRASIINDDKAAFSKIMPKGVDAMFDDFKAAFDEYKGILEGIIKEWKMTSLKNYITESSEIQLDEGNRYPESHTVRLSAARYILIPTKLYRPMNGSEIDNGIYWFNKMESGMKDYFDYNDKGYDDDDREWMDFQIDRLKYIKLGQIMYVEGRRGVCEDFWVARPDLEDDCPL